MYVPIFFECADFNGLKLSNLSMSSGKCMILHNCSTPVMRENSAFITKMQRVHSKIFRTISVNTESRFLVQHKRNAKNVYYRTSALLEKA